MAVTMQLNKGCLKEEIRIVRTGILKSAPFDLLRYVLKYYTVDPERKNTLTVVVDVAQVVPLTYLVLIRFVQKHINVTITIGFFIWPTYIYCPPRHVLNSHNIMNNNIIIDCRVVFFCGMFLVTILSRAVCIL